MEEIATSKFIKSHGKYVIILFLIIVAGNVLLYFIYQNVRQEMIDGLNSRQLIHAKQAAKGIETFFADHINVLQNYCKNENIINFGEAGKQVMREYLFAHGEETSIVARMDSRGRIIHAEPYNKKVIGQPVTKMEDFLKVRRTHQVVVSDVFTNRRGFKSIIIHAAVFKNGHFDGTLALLVSYEFIAKRYIDDIRIGKEGYAWMVSKNGIELSCPIPGHVGKSVFDNCREFPDILTMAERMTRGEQGVAAYMFDRIRENTVSKMSKHAVFMPIRIGDNFWSIVVATPETEVTGVLSAFRNKLLFIAILLLIAIGFFFYMLIKTSIAVKESELRRKSEEALRESEELFRTSMERAPDGVYMNDLEGNFLYGNHKAEEIIGYKREEIIGRNFLDLNLIAEGSLTKAAELLQANIEGRSTGPDELEMLREDGSNILVDITTTLIHRGGKINVLAFVRDITARKQAEDEKCELQERLNRAEKMEALGTLAGGVAHDLNNVLGIVVGYAELAMDTVDKLSPLRHDLETIMNGGHKAAAIVDDLLTLARRGVPASNVINLNKIITDYQKSPEFEKLYSNHSAVKIKTEFEQELLNIFGSSVHIGKTLYNLVSNASEAMTQGGTLTIKTTNQYLDKPIFGYDNIREGDYVVLSVSDTGEGINNIDLKRIFEPFYTKKIMGRSGTGLGLAVVWGTVKDHKGYINVQSEEGKGSTFALYFPVTREEITTETVTIAISEYMGKGESILIVDDIKEQRDLATGMLKTLNYKVVSVRSGEESIEYLKEHKVDLILLDMIMDPGMDGLDTYKSILKTNQKQKAIIVSGFSQSDRVKAAEELGVGSYLKKPYIKEKLGMAVRKELDRK